MAAYVPYVWSTGDTVTAARLNNLESQYASFMSMATLFYPIGSSYENVSVPTNPATLLGFGTWVLHAPGAVEVCVDISQVEFNAIGLTGGTKIHAITESELPFHTHLQDSHNHLQEQHRHPLNGTGNVWNGFPAFGDFADAADDSGTILTSSVAAVNIEATATNQSIGSGLPHNNLMPYLTSWRWKRTA